MLKGQKVENSKKIVSIFEDHASIIIKGKRETQFGRKLFLSSGKSGMITSFKIVEGNPSDTELFMPMVDEHTEQYGKPPRQITVDGGFASEDNFEAAKGEGTKDIVFTKTCGLDKDEMASSENVYTKLRNFRAGIEAGISWLKKSFGLSKVYWKGKQNFKRCICASITSFNLRKLALALT